MHVHADDASKVGTFLNSQQHPKERKSKEGNINSTYHDVVQREREATVRERKIETKERGKQRGA